MADNKRHSKRSKKQTRGLQTQLSEALMSGGKQASTGPLSPGETAEFKTRLAEDVSLALLKS